MQKQATIKPIEHQNLVIEQNLDLEKSRENVAKAELKAAIESVLDNELSLWREYAGRLGSILTYYKGRLTRGIGTEWREEKVIRIRALSESEKGWVTSKNADALIQIYHRLADRKLQSHFISTLSSTLSRDTKYATVAYLILLVLFRLRELQKAINVAADSLVGDRGFAFSDFLRLLDGLLRFEPAQFSTDLINAVETFIEKVDIHAFRINQRISALKTANQQCWQN